MPDHFDADTVLLQVVGGQSVADEPPGFATFAAPRRAARGREKDVLFLALNLRARNTLAADRYTELLHLAANTFFGSGGSVTSAARQAIFAVNKSLLENNLRTGPPVQGGLLCVILRQAEVYAVQAGPTQLIVGHAETVERFPASAGRPLGVSDSVDTLYFHTRVQTGNYLALTGNANWRDLSGLGGLATLTAAADRLKECALSDFAAMVIRLEPEGSVGAEPMPSPGVAETAVNPLSGWTERLRAVVKPPEPERTSVAEPEPEPVVNAPLNLPPTETVNIAPAAVEAAVGAAVPVSEPPAAGTNWQDLLRRTERWKKDDQPSAQILEEPPAPELRPFQREASPVIDWGQLRAQAENGLRSFGRAVGVTLTEVIRALRKLMARVLPEGTLQRDGMFTVPTTVQIGVAILLPIVIAGMAGLIYIQQGREQDFEEALSQAQTAVAVARTQTDVNQARTAWENALAWAERAESLRPGLPEVATLRLEAQSQVDALNGTARVAFTPLLPAGIAPEANITKLALGGRDVFALDSANNRVWRLTQNQPGVYTLDENFQCASGNLNPIVVGPLVDIQFVAGPPPAPGEGDTDVLLALDNAGALMYCKRDTPPLGSYLANDMGWVQPRALELYANSLYVLDTGQNQIWQYTASGDIFNQPPERYFSDVIYDLRDIVDFSIAGGEVFLLRADGRVAICNRAFGGNGVCNESAPFTDERPGRVSGNRLQDVLAPSAMLYDAPPEPSIFLLNPQNNGLYQLSLKLVFTRQFQAQQTFSQPISAMAIDPNKRFFVGVGNNVYAGNRP